MLAHGKVNFAMRSLSGTRQTSNGQWLFDGRLHVPVTWLDFVECLICAMCPILSLPSVSSLLCAGSRQRPCLPCALCLP